MHLNIEIKARCSNLTEKRDWLLANGADFKGTDDQTDTYFMVPHGRLKLRQGNIENALIHYDRDNHEGPRDSRVTMTGVANGPELKKVLEKACGVMVEVSKHREIYFIGNVKFHLDEVPGLGTFVEIEAIDKDGSIGREQLLQQCEDYLGAFQIERHQLVSHSYSDMLMGLR